MDVCASVYLLLVKHCLDIAMMFLCFFFVFIAGVWLCFFCCPLQGGSKLQPAHEPVNPNMSLVELKP